MGFLLDRVIANAVPAPPNPARYPGVEEYYWVLLDDLVESRATVEPSLKREFIDFLLDDEDLQKDNLNSGEAEMTYDNIFKFAAIPPVIDLEEREL